MKAIDHHYDNFSADHERMQRPLFGAIDHEQPNQKNHFDSIEILDY